jgi:hypothetical protein
MELVTVDYVLAMLAVQLMAWMRRIPWRIVRIVSVQF